MTNEEYIRELEKNFNSRLFITAGDLYEGLGIDPCFLSTEARNEIIWRNPELEDVVFLDFNTDTFEVQEVSIEDVWDPEWRFYGNKIDYLETKINRKFNELERRINNA